MAYTRRMRVRMRSPRSVRFANGVPQPKCPDCVLTVPESEQLGNRKNDNGPETVTGFRPVK